MLGFVLVGLGGFLGAIARYGVYLIERATSTHVFPFGTLVINFLGCLLAGLILGFTERGDSVSKQWLLFCSMGFIGSFTTFSTFSVESFQLIRNNEITLAIANMTLNLVIGVFAVWLGRGH